MATAKKGYGGGGGVGTAATVKAKSHSVEKLSLDIPIDEARAAQIQRCMKKGKLKITFDKVDLTTGRLGDGWLYD